MLRELQLELSRAFLDDTSGGADARAVTGALVPLRGAGVERGLGAYQSALRHVVLSALGEIFPVCRALVGSECFAVIARHHRARCASTHPDLGRIGSVFPELIESLAFLDEVPYLADVARLELALHRAADAADAEAPVDAEALGAALSESPESHRFTLPPSATLLESPYPVLAIWEAHQGDPDRLARIELDRRGSPERLVVWRGRSGVDASRLDERAWAVLTATRAGADVAALLAVSGSDVRSRLADPADLYAPVLEAITDLFEMGLLTGVERL